MLRKNNNGITLIALVVTIIVLLILAGVSISMLTGQNGILNRAAEAKEKTETSGEDEKRKLAQAEALMNMEKTTYKGVTLPEGFAPTKIDGEDSIDEGLVITDGYGNEYVWVEVPKTAEVYKNAGLGITEFSDEECGKIENDLYTYTSMYEKRISYNDKFYNDSESGWFKNESEYNNAKYKMLKSVYQNGGFWVGRYESGIATNRTSGEPTTVIPVTKANMYPYTYVTRTQAKTLAESVESGSYTSSLMFEIQWNLVLKYMEGKNNITVDKLTQNSTSIGNYNNNYWNITNQSVKYSKNYGVEFKNAPYQKDKNEDILLTTGADDSFSIANIYDIAGNVWEWTLGKAANDENPCVCNGGSLIYSGEVNSANSHYAALLIDKSYDIGFRVSMY